MPPRPAARDLARAACVHAARLAAPRLGVLRQHPPRPLRLPPPGPAPPADAPVISVVTPSYQQGEYLERTLRSVLGQGYPRLEYIVQDGGSADATADILARHAARLRHWESGPDGGQAHAINLGFRRATGGIMAYLNADDLLLPGSLAAVAAFFAAHPGVDAVYGHRVVIDERDGEVGRWVLPPHAREAFLWRDYVPQETLFWRRRLWDRVGGAVDESLRFAVDWDLLLRFARAGACFARLPRFLGAFRVHAAQKTSAEMASTGRAEIRRLQVRYHGRELAEAEIDRRVRRYLQRHVLYDWLYRAGLLGV